MRQFKVMTNDEYQKALFKIKIIIIIIKNLSK